MWANRLLSIVGHRGTEVLQKATCQKYMFDHLIISLKYLKNPVCIDKNSGILEKPSHIRGLPSTVHTVVLVRSNKAAQKDLIRRVTQSS
jgi:hypothetical protein